MLLSSYSIQLLKDLMNFHKNQLNKTKLLILTIIFGSINQDKFYGYPEPIFSGHGILRKQLKVYHKTSKKAFNIISPTIDRKLDKSIGQFRQSYVQSDRQSQLEMKKGRISKNE